MYPRLSQPGRDLRERKFYPPSLPPRHVGASIPCVRCGYDLKTLHVHRRCPECGLMVDWSLARHAAGRATPMRRLAVAAGVTVASFVALASVDPTGTLYPSAVIVFTITFLAAGTSLFNQLLRNP